MLIPSISDPVNFTLAQVLMCMDVLVAEEFTEDVFGLIVVSFSTLTNVSNQRRTMSDHSHVYNSGI